MGGGCTEAQRRTSSAQRVCRVPQTKVRHTQCWKIAKKCLIQSFSLQGCHWRTIGQIPRQIGQKCQHTWRSRSAKQRLGNDEVPNRNVWLGSFEICTSTLGWIDQDFRNQRTKSWQKKTQRRVCQVRRETRRKFGLWMSIKTFPRLHTPFRNGAPK